MKRILFSLCLLLGLSFPAVLALSPAQFYLGGITVGSTADYVRSIYGQPTVSNPVKQGPDGYFYSYQYGSSVQIAFDANSNRVTAVYSTANNGFATPAGLTVGMDAAAISRLYGTPDKEDRGTISYHIEGKWLVFNTHNGKITEIKLFDYLL